MEQLYMFLSFITLLGGVMVMSSLNPMHSVFWLVLVFLNSSILLILLGFNFMPLMLMIVYVGAMAMLFLFVMMMLDVLQLSSIESISNMIPVVMCAFVNALSYILLYFKDYNIVGNMSNNCVWNLGSESQVNFIAKSLYSFYGYPFIMISLLLLVAMMGAIILVLDLGLMTKSQILIDQHQSLMNKD